MRCRERERVLSEEKARFWGAALHFGFVARCEKHRGVGTQLTLTDEKMSDHFLAYMVVQALGQKFESSHALAVGQEVKLVTDHIGRFPKAVGVITTHGDKLGNVENPLGDALFVYLKQPGVYHKAWVYLAGWHGAYVACALFGPGPGMCSRCAQCCF